ncbi:MAG: hypothetical protein QM765_44765 [Myxococcales bacterium]
MRAVSFICLVVLVACRHEEHPSIVKAQYPDGSPLKGAKVSINGKAFGETDDAGRIDASAAFDAVDRREGLRFHGVTIDKSEDTCSFSHVAKLLDLSIDNTVIVPRPVTGLRALETHPKSVRLSWGQADEVGFGEYRIYSSVSDGFDDNTGLLEATEGDRTTTEAILSNALSNGTVAHGSDRVVVFRVFVHDADGTKTGSCGLEVRPPVWEGAGATVVHHLVAERSFEVPVDIHGLAHDGTTLWVVYAKVIGNSVEGKPNELAIAQLDLDTAQLLEKVSFQHSAFPSGLAWDGQVFWFTGDLAAAGHLGRYDPQTNTAAFLFEIEYGTMSVAWNGEHLLLNKYWAEIEKVDRATGSVVGEITNPFDVVFGNANEGLAYRPGELWLAHGQTSDIAIVNDAGEHIGLAAGGPGTLSQHPQLVFVGDKLVSAADKTVTVYRIDP